MKLHSAHLQKVGIPVENFSGPAAQFYCGIQHLIPIRSNFQSYSLLSKMFRVFVVLSCIAAANAHVLLTGDHGSGKTKFFCHHEGKDCQGSSSEMSDTSHIQVGGFSIDTPGFLENRVQEGELQGSSWATYTILDGIRGVGINAIAWVVNCNVVKGKYDDMKYFSDMLGNGIPIVAVFNDYGHGSCIKNQDSFLKFTSDMGINVQEVIMFNDFNKEQFMGKYSEEFFRDSCGA